LGLFAALLADHLAALRLENVRWPQWLIKGAKLISAGLILLLGVRAMQADGQWGNLALALWLLGQIVMTGLYCSGANMLVLVAGLAAISVVASPAWSFAVALAATYAFALRQFWQQR
jgi:hypothetical protein